MEITLKAKIFDLEIGRYEATLNETDAKKLGVRPKDRIKLFSRGKSIVAVVNTTKTVIKAGEIGISADILKTMGVKESDDIIVAPTEKPKSVEYIRKKMQGVTLSEAEFESIVKDVVTGRLSEVEITAFVSAIYINGLNIDEAAYLSKKMAETGEILEIRKKPVFDKHSLGGVPGNKITLLVVPIVAAAGLAIPKTSSRAITSACGTADIMEVLAPVTFNASEIVEIVDRTNGIIAWGGGVNLAPADDIFIRVEYPLAIDPHYLALCSVMAKKYAVGADFVVIDLPMGSETKIPTMEDARKYARDFLELGERLDITVECAVTYGDKPIGRAVGPALEAKEGLKALEGEGPSSLIEKSTDIAGILLEAGGIATKGNGKQAAMEILKSGKALKKMKEIIEAQGGDPKVTSDYISVGRYKETIYSPMGGYVTHISNKAIVQVARAAGSPKSKGAGIHLYITKGTKVAKGEPLFDIYAESEWELEEASKLAKQLLPVRIEGMILKRFPEYTFIGER